MELSRAMIEASIDVALEKKLVDMAMACVVAVIAGQKTVTLAVTGKKTKGFPSGELLSIGTNGAKNYAIDPIKLLKWVHSQTMADAQKIQINQFEAAA